MISLFIETSWKQNESTTGIFIINFSSFLFFNPILLYATVTIICEPLEERNPGATVMFTQKSPEKTLNWWSKVIKYGVATKKYYWSALVKWEKYFTNQIFVIPTNNWCHWVSHTISNLKM